MPAPPPLPAGPVPSNAIKIKSKKGPRNTTKNQSYLAETTEKPKVVQTNRKDNVKKEQNHDNDDGWEHYFDDDSQRFFFYNLKTKTKQWKNPRVADDDDFNRDLPSYPPPKLPFEEDVIESHYTIALKSMKEDSEFQKLSTFEKYKRAKELKEKYDRSEDGAETPILTSQELKDEVKDIESFSDSTNFSDFGSKSIYAAELNSSIKSLNNSSNNSSKSHKISKKQIKQFNDRKKQQREHKIKNWLTKD